jgi:radical SAM superfamily enzyme YgiQ (UPF0313 family)
VRLLLISPGREWHKRRPYTLRLPQLALNVVASLTPNRYHIKLVEEDLEDLDLDQDCDIVGISAMTANVTRGYEVAAEFRKRGKTVILGGVHPTVLPEEASRYADSVVIGEAEDTWPQLLNDFENNRLEKSYRSKNIDVSNFPSPRYDLTPKRAGGFFDVTPIVTTRGCPYDCEFCGVPDFYGKKLRSLPVERVVRDIEVSGGRMFLFMDDNVLAKRAYMMELFKAMKPLKIQWIGQSSITFVRDTELIRAAAESGCQGLFFGLESVSTCTRTRMRKTAKDLSHDEESIRKVQGEGILFHASLVVGFDGEDESIFDDTLEFLMRNRIATASINVLTPYPGTRVFDQMQSQGRLLTKDWRYYDHSCVVFRPSPMTPLQLLEGHQRICMEFYKLSSIARRLNPGVGHMTYYILGNLGYRKRVRRDQRNLPNEIRRLQTLEAGAPRLDPEMMPATILEHITANAAQTAAWRSAVVAAGRKE